MTPSTRDQFTVAIICALVEEADAVEALFDVSYDRMSLKYKKARRDRNSYLNGRIGKYDVVVCYMPGIGKGSAAMVASDLRSSYTNIQLALVVGVCAGVPKKSNGQPIFLGDAIISDSVIEYDFGRQYPNGFRRKRNVKDTLGRPSHELRALIAGLSGDQTRMEFQRKMTLHVQTIQKPGAKWNRPAFDDILFESSYTHKHHEKAGNAKCICLSGDISDGVCEGALKTDCVTLCEEDRICRRRSQANIGDAVLHIGAIASADTVMKSGIHRDKLADEEEIIALEMEGAGVWDNFPCIIVKGVCDYADSHKNSNWQLYAAANGAAAAKTLLEYVTLDAVALNPGVKSGNQIQWMVPFRRNPKFVGRHGQIGKLRSLISDPNGPRELAITGLGGVGKTQVALELAYQMRDTDPHCSVLWIPCTSQENVEQAFTELARRLQLSGPTNAKAKVQNYLNQENSGRWILIFDNADNEYMWMKDKNALRDFVPDNENGRTLFTSRNGQLAIDLADVNIIEIDQFDLETGKEFLRRSLLRQDLLHDHDTVVLFFEYLSFLPLAITQAAAYVNKNRINLSAYIDLLGKQEKQMIEVLSENFQDKWRYKDVQNPVATTWWISFQQIQQGHPLAAEYLCFMACINPRDIPQSMLPPAPSENENTKAIGLLKSYAFVSDSEPAEDKLLNMHRLVHVATRNWMRTNATLEPQMLKIVDQLRELFSHYRPRFSPSIFMPYEEKSLTIRLPHALALLREECVRSQRIKQSNLMAGVMTYLLEIMRFEEVENLGTQYIRYMDLKEDPEYLILGVLELLVAIPRMNLRPQATNEVVDQLLDRSMTIILQDRLFITPQKSSSTNTERNGNIETAIATFMQSSRVEVDSALENQRLLASLYAQLERYKESEKFYLQTIENSTVILGSNHPMTLRCQVGLAEMYCESKQVTKAEEIYLHIVREACNCAEGSNCANLMVYQHALAKLYCDIGRYSDSEQIYTRVIEMSKAINGPGDIRTLHHQFELANVYRYQKRYKRAEELMTHVIEREQLMLGSNFAFGFVQHLSGLIDLYGYMGELNKRKELLTRFEQYRERVAEALPPRHSFTKFAHAFMARSSLASLYEEQNSLYRERVSLYNEQVSLYNEQNPLYEEQNSLYRERVSLYNEQVSLYNEQISLYEKLIALNKRISSLEKRICPLEREIVSLEKRICPLEREIASLEERICSLEREIASLLEENPSLGTYSTEESCREGVAKRRRISMSY